MSMKFRSKEYIRRSNLLRKQRERHEARRKVRRKAKRLGRTERHAFARRADIPFDPNSRREQIVLPSEFSFAENYEQTAETIMKVREKAIEDRRQVMLHFAHVENVEPAAALALVSEVHRARGQRGPGFVTGTYPRSRSVYDALREMGFYAVLNVLDFDDEPEPKAEPGKPIFLRFISEFRVFPQLADQFVSIVEKALIPMDKLARQRLVVAIKEAMQNTLDHAHPGSQGQTSSQHRWWMSSWVNLERKEVSIVFFDQGVGIPKTLEPNTYEKIVAAIANVSNFKFSSKPSDGELIAAATEIFRSGTGTPGRGQGFQNMKSFVDVCDDGELRILSNRGRYHYMGNDKETCSDSSQPLGGTVIEWRFRHEGVVEMTDE
nr:ATP-binding protein [Erythrobacter sp. THAF29]